MKQVFYLYRDFTQMLNKHRGYIPFALFEDALAFASRGLFDHYYGNTEEYRPGRPLPRVAYQVTTAVSDALHPFLKTVTYQPKKQSTPVPVRGGEISLGDIVRELALVLPDTGIVALPAGLVHPTSFSVRGAKEAVEVLDDNEVQTVLNSTICAPTPEYPKLEMVPGGYKLHGGATNLTIKYLSLPTRPVYGITYQNDEPVYDDAKSVDTGWPESRHNQLLTRMLEYPGLMLRDQVVQQVAAQLTAQGK